MLGHRGKFTPADVRSQARVHLARATGFPLPPEDGSPQPEALMSEAGPLSVPPGGTLAMKPGGTHIMLMDLKGGLKVG